MKAVVSARLLFLLNQLAMATLLIMPEAKLEPVAIITNVP
jgi:hypothetical protein